MTRKYSTNPIICYLQHHDWEWLTAEQIINATKCAPNDLEALFDVTCYRCMIERQNGKYRYVGNLNSPRMKIVKTLKDVYPMWLTGTDLRKRGNITGSVGNIIFRSSDRLPVNMRREYRGKYQGTVTLYQYIPDDPRSLVEYRHTSLEYVRKATRDTIYSFLHDHPGEFYSAAEISAELGASNASIVGNNMRVLMREHPGEITMERMEWYNSYKLRKYAYIQSASEHRKPNPVTA